MMTKTTAQTEYSKADSIIIAEMVRYGLRLTDPVRRRKRIRKNRRRGIIPAVMKTVNAIEDVQKMSAKLAETVWCRRAPG